MPQFTSTILSASSGVVAVATAAQLQNEITMWVAIVVGVVTTAVNLILDIRKKWAKTTKEIEEMKKENKKEGE